MQGGNREEMLGGNISTQHQPVILRIGAHLSIYFNGCGFATHLFMDFSQYLLTLKHHDLIHHLLRAGSNPSLIARGHVGCRVEFHPASLSEA